MGYIYNYTIYYVYYTNNIRNSEDYYLRSMTKKIQGIARPPFNEIVLQLVSWIVDGLQFSEAYLCLLNSYFSINI